MVVRGQAGAGVRKARSKERRSNTRRGVSAILTVLLHLRLALAHPHLRVLVLSIERSTLLEALQGSGVLLQVEARDTAGARAGSVVDEVCERR